MFLKPKILISATLAFGLAACSASPEDRAEEFYFAVSNNETGEALGYIDPGLAQAFGPKLSSNLSKNYEKSEKQGGLESLEASSEIEGDRAIVKVTATYGDGSTKAEELKMREIDDQWYITM